MTVIVELIAATRPLARPTVLDEWGRNRNPWEHPLDVVEFAGRTCYLSYDKPNPDTRERDDYLRNIITQQHYSVLEHASATFYIGHVSRSLLAELTRHRHLSFSVQSQRYVNESFKPVIPPALEGMEEEVWDAYRQAYVTYMSLREALLDSGLPRKKANEAARAVLPNAQATSMVVTGNLRAWREVIAKRNSPHADAEISRLAQRILELLTAEFPAVFDEVK